MRKTKEELNAIKQKYGVDELWSWSRFNSYITSPYEYFLRYIVRIKEDRSNSIYTYAGSLAHTILENLYEGKITYEQLSDEFYEQWFLLSQSDYKFDRTDEIKNKNIEAKYTENLKHFFKNHVQMQGKIEIERFITIKVGNHIFQGYIDAISKENDNIIITDFKTSSIYQGDKISKQAGQLVLYAEGLRQMGIPLEKLKIRWNFLKYCTVTQTQKAIDKETKKNKTSQRNIERCKLGENLQSNAKMWLKECGYAEQIDDYLALLLQTNSIECLPQEVQDKYQIDDCYVYIPLSEEIINNLKIGILDTIHEIKTKELEYQKTKDDKVFYDSPEKVEKESFYFATLMGYSANLHKPYGEYLNKLKAEQEQKNNMFSGIGVSDNDINGTNNSQIDEYNLDWLNQI